MNLCPKRLLRIATGTGRAGQINHVGAINVAVAPNILRLRLVVNAALHHVAFELSVHQSNGGRYESNASNILSKIYGREAGKQAPADADGMRAENISAKECG